MKDIFESYLEYLPHPDEPPMVNEQSLGTKFKEYIQHKFHFGNFPNNRLKHS